MLERLFPAPFVINAKQGLIFKRRFLLPEQNTTTLEALGAAEGSQFLLVLTFPGGTKPMLNIAEYIEPEQAAQLQMFPIKAPSPAGAAKPAAGAAAPKPAGAAPAQSAAAIPNIVVQVRSLLSLLIGYSRALDRLPRGLLCPPLSTSSNYMLSSV